MVDGLSFPAPPGAITAFIGPNGAGKTTTLRALLGLIRPDEGRALVHGRPYSHLSHPLRHVGAVIEGAEPHPDLTVGRHLRWFARAGGIGPPPEGLLEAVGLAGMARRRYRGLSSGQRQRLALATALVGDPDVLILDEPGTGLDPQGFRWLRESLVARAQQGHCILVSSHLLDELSKVANRFVMIDRGCLVADVDAADLVGDLRLVRIDVEAAARSRLAASITAAGISVHRIDPALEVVAAASDVEAVLGPAGARVSWSEQRRATAEEAYLAHLEGRS